jgi:hypothetical protein
MAPIESFEPIPVAVEGIVDEAVLSRVLRDFGVRPFPVYGKQGCSNLDLRLDGFNAAAVRSPWIVLRDLDNGGRCPVTFARQRLPTPSRKMLFRIVVNEIEAWLLADAGSLAKFLGISTALVPLQPETLDDPKQVLTQLAARSRFRRIREDIAPRTGSGISPGPAYAARLIEYAGNHWSPTRAELCAPSLRSFRKRLRELVQPDL